MTSPAWQAGQPYPAHWQNFYFLDADHGVLHATTTGIPCDTGAGYFYTATKNKKASSEKLRMKKYDPKVRQHVEFVEEKLR